MEIPAKKEREGGSCREWEGKVKENAEPRIFEEYTCDEQGSGQLRKSDRKKEVIWAAFREGAYKKTVGGDGRGSKELVSNMKCKSTSA